MTELILPAHNFTYDGAVINIFHADKGQGLPRHDHKYAHATFCSAGSVVIKKEGKSVTVDKLAQPIDLVADQWHEIEALEDGTVFVNVFSETKR